MTCIVGLKTENSLIIGGDHAVNDGDRVHIMGPPKVFKRGRFVIGYCGSLRIGQLIEHSLTIPPGISKKGPLKYLITDFANAMRNCLNMAGAARKDKEEEEQENRFIVGVEGRLFEIDESYAVCELTDGMVAIGSGVEFALGSLHSTVGEDPKIRVEKALAAAAYYCPTVSEPFTIFKMNLKKGPQSGNKTKRNTSKKIGKEENGGSEGVKRAKGQTKIDVQEDQRPDRRGEGNRESNSSSRGENEGNSGDGSCDSAVPGED